MTPAARLAAAASVLDSIAQGRQPAEAVLKAWGGANRYAGSKDRRAIADRVYKVLRARGRLSWIMGGREDGRALVIGSLHAIDGLSLEEIEADVIRLAIGHYRGRMTEVARRLGIGRSTLYRKLGELGLEGAA